MSKKKKDYPSICISAPNAFSDSVPHRRAKRCWHGSEPVCLGAVEVLCSSPGYRHAAYRRVRHDGALDVGLHDEGYVGRGLRLFAAFVGMFGHIFDKDF